MYVEENAGNMDAGSWEIKIKCAGNLEFNMTLSPMGTIRTQEEKGLKWQEQTGEKVRWKNWAIVSRAIHVAWHRSSVHAKVLFRGFEGEQSNLAVKVIAAL